MCVTWFKFTFLWYLILQQFSTYNATVESSEFNSGHLNPAKLSSLDIDESLNKLRQDDPKLINILKKHYIIPPSKIPYNFTRSKTDTDGQFGQAAYIANTFFM